MLDISIKNLAIVQVRFTNEKEINQIILPDELQLFA